MSISLLELTKWTKKLNLLYVEDNEEARKFTVEMLSRFFENLDVAENGIDGLEKFQTKKFDIVLSDINMPKMNGVEMISSMKKINTGFVALVLSAHNEKYYYDEAAKQGIRYYLAKPLSLSELIETLTGLLNNEPSLMDKK